MTALQNELICQLSIVSQMGPKGIFDVTAKQQDGDPIRETKREDIMGGGGEKEQ